MDRRVAVLVEPLSLLMSELTEIATRIEGVHQSHSARVEAAAVRLQDMLTEQVTADLRQRLDCEFQEAAHAIRTELEERMRVATDQWALERKSLLHEIASLRQRDRRELSIEIAQSQAALNQIRITIQTMLNDPSVAISKLVRARAREGELAAYLKGLNFNAGIVDAPATERHEVAVAGD